MKCAACGVKTHAHDPKWAVLCPDHWQQVEAMTRPAAVAKLGEWLYKRDYDKLVLLKT